MRGIILVLLFVLFFTSGAVSLADPEPQPTDIVWCCDRGRCLRIAKDGCDKFGGYVVNTCDDCQ
ncbi:MAG: hypothetical protein ACLP5H_17540 [Desulfomonilaceae bacterium]